MAGTEDITALLLAWGGSAEAADSRLVEAVYDELRRLARRQLARERPNHSLSPTALVNEAYLKLIDQRRVRWQNRAHFFAVAAQLMRRVLVDHARARATAKRGGITTISLDGVDVGAPVADLEILALDGALEKLGRVDARQKRLVELRYFAGLTIEEVAGVLDVAPITVKRDWALARAWLFRELRQDKS